MMAQVPVCQYIVDRTRPAEHRAAWTGSRQRVSACDSISRRDDAISRGLRGASLGEFLRPARADGVHHRPLGSRQEHDAAPDHTDRAVLSRTCGGRRTQSFADSRTPHPAVSTTSRRGVPGSSAAAGADRIRQCGAAIGRGRVSSRRGAPAGAGRSRPGRPAREGTPATEGAFRAGSSSGSVSRERSFTGHRCCSRTNRPGISTPSSAATRWRCSSASTRLGAPWSLRRTIWRLPGPCRTESLLCVRVPSSTTRAPEDEGAKTTGGRTNSSTCP